MASPSRTIPFSSARMQRSASPSKAAPRSAPSAATRAAISPGAVEPQLALTLRPSGPAWREVTPAPSRAKSSAANPEAAPLPVSSTTRSPASGRLARHGGHGRREVVEVALAHRRIGVGLPVHDDVPDLRPRPQPALERRLRLVAPLRPPRIEQLDAVVRVRVVARRDDDAGLGAGLPRQVGHPRGGDHTGIAHLDSGGGEAGGEPAADLGGALAGVAAEHHPRGGAFTRALLAESLAEMDGERRHRRAVERRLAEVAADAVGAEQAGRRVAQGCFPFRFGVSVG